MSTRGDPRRQGLRSVIRAVVRAGALTVTTYPSTSDVGPVDGGVQPSLRSVLQLDGDIMTFVSPSAWQDPQIVARHVADVREALAPLRQLLTLIRRGPFVAGTVGSVMTVWGVLDAVVKGDFAVTTGRVLALAAVVALALCAVTGRRVLSSWLRWIAHRGVPDFGVPASKVGS